MYLSYVTFRPREIIKADVLRSAVVRVLALNDGKYVIYTHVYRYLVYVDACVTLI